MTLASGVVGAGVESDGVGVIDGAGDCTGIALFEGKSVGDGEGLETGLAEGVAIDVTMVSGEGSGVAEGVASGSSSGGIVSAEFVLVKIVSGFRRGSSGLGAGVLAECVATSGGDSWAFAPGGAGRSEIQG